MQKQRKYSETEMIVVNAYWRLKMRAKKTNVYVHCTVLWLPLWQYPFCSQSTWCHMISHWDRVFYAFNVVFFILFLVVVIFFSFVSQFSFVSVFGIRCEFHLDQMWCVMVGWWSCRPPLSPPPPLFFWFLCVAEWICHFAGVQNGCDSCRVIFSIIDLSDFRRLTIHFTPQSLTHGMSSFQIIRHRNCHQHRHCCSHLMGGCILHTAYCMCTHSHPHTYTVRIVQCTFYGHCVVYFGFPLSYSSSSSLSPFKCIDLAKWENQIFVCVFFAFCKY